MAASIIPAPIVQSTYALPSQPLELSVVDETTSPEHDRQHELEADLQYLLDIQAEALTKGVGGTLPDDRNSTGSTTPTALSYRSQSARRSKAPVRKRPGIKSTRKAIYNCIVALSSVKGEEVSRIESEYEENKRALEQIDDWQKKRQGLKEASEGFEGNEETVRSQRLMQEADALQIEINNVEMQLAEMKTRHRKIVKQAAALNNSMQARMASYESSQSMLEADVHRFLSREPPTHRVLPQDASMWELPAGRRTLEMAREYWQLQNEAVEDQRKDAEREKGALDEGAATWRGAVMEITEFEKAMRAEISGMSPSNSTYAWENHPPDNQSQRLGELIAHLDSVIGSIDAKFKLAEDRNWRLLIAAIGAELDALRQGKRVLQGLHQDKSQSEDLLSGNDPAASSSQHTEQGRDAGSRAEAHQGRFASQASHDDSHSATDTDEDPDPELLFSRQDTEGE
ncbi:hypothetical protein K431DRAFT_267681 [Polychaeton citri CBS 116435]|uniref:Atg28p n=1 Tax=Polychaeton citri CBS 116435 TaxID=1314669 RepID=A0A9P4Q977_9PEZI|nr:hypothetical protein K431DRAFT_267681 [Polychaeton citri CBS 116435]